MTLLFLSYLKILKILGSHSFFFKAFRNKIKKFNLAMTFLKHLNLFYAIPYLNILQIVFYFVKIYFSSQQKDFQMFDTTSKFLISKTKMNIDYLLVFYFVKIYFSSQQKDFQMFDTTSKFLISKTKMNIDYLLNLSKFECYLARKLFFIQQKDFNVCASFTFINIEKCFNMLSVYFVVFYFVKIYFSSQQKDFQMFDTTSKFLISKTKMNIDYLLVFYFVKIYFSSQQKDFQMFDTTSKFLISKTKMNIDYLLVFYFVKIYFSSQQKDFQMFDTTSNKFEEYHLCFNSNLSHGKLLQNVKFE
ncbi:hypothetical protein AGLY_016372, partial [Aphis glycines]